VFLPQSEDYGDDDDDDDDDDDNNNNNNNPLFFLYSKANRPIPYCIGHILLCF
jgi:hypothetical protein